MRPRSAQRTVGDMRGDRERVWGRDRALAVGARVVCGAAVARTGFQGVDMREK